MAMQLNLRKQVEEENRANQTKQHTKKEREIEQALWGDQPFNFTKLLLYGGQGEHPNRSLSSFRDTQTPGGHAGSQDPPSPRTTGSAKPPGNLGKDHKGEIKEEGETQSGLEQPRLAATGEEITGANKNKMQAENRKRRRALQQAQQAATQWTMHLGATVITDTASDKSRPAHQNSSAPPDGQ
jgi:hypothetical protein